MVSLVGGSLLLELACGDSGYTPPPGDPPADLPGYYIDCDASMAWYGRGTELCAVDLEDCDG